MLSIPKILVPVNFSDNCKGAARYAESLAEHFGSEVTVLHVLDPPEGLEGLDSMSPAAAEFFRNRQARTLRELESSFVSSLPPHRFLRAVVEGDPAIEIVRYAASREMELIVMPTHGYGPIRQFLLGSVTAKVLHDVKCPVWTGVHMQSPPVAYPLEVRALGCAVDLGPQTRSIVCWAAGFARSWGASLHILHVSPNVPDPECKTRIEVLAHDGITTHEAAVNYPAAKHIGFGSVGTVVGRMARDHQLDVLVVGRSHRPGGGHLPTNAYGIIRGAPCPVISV